MASKPYTTAAWKSVRKRVLFRDGYMCQLRSSVKCRGGASQAHHLRDWRDGGAWYDERNLVAACVSCNVAERNRRANRALREQRALESEKTYPKNTRW